MKTIFEKFVFILILILAGCAEASPTPIPTPTPILEPIIFQLHWEPTADFIGFYVALGNGYYEEEGLDVTIQPLSHIEDGISIPSKIVAGDFDYAISGVDLLRAQAAGESLVVIAEMMKFGPGAFFTRTELGITNPADFAGHSVVVKAAGWETLLIDFLALADLTLDDVVVVEGSFDMTPFLDGEVEIWAGFITDEVVRARLAGLDIVTFPLYDYGRRGGAVTVYTSQERLNNNSDQVEGFLRASIRGWQWAIDNPEEAVDIFLELNPNLADKRDFYILSFNAVIPLIIPPGTNLGEIDCEFWAAHEQLANLESTEGLCTTAIFEAVHEEQ